MYYKSILCVSKNYGISYANNIPWRIKDEMRFFRERTTKVYSPYKKNCVVMGRKTFDNILFNGNNKNGLQNRLNIVLSKDSDLQKKYKHNHNIQVINSFEKLEKILKVYEKYNIIETCWFIGGVAIFDYAFKKNYEIFLNIIDEEYECDNFIDKKKFDDYKTVYSTEVYFFCEIKFKPVKIQKMILKKEINN